MLLALLGDESGQIVLASIVQHHKKCIGGVSSVATFTGLPLSGS